MPANKDIKVRIYGEIHTIKVEEGDTILNAALSEGLDPPFSCQVGACGTCRAKLQSGEVTMDERDALTDGEILDGYILTCQSHPVTDNIFVDYDD